MMRSIAPTCAVVLALTAGPKAPAQAPPPAPDLVGDWKGELKPVPGLSLTLVLHVTKADGDTLAATMDSPDQGSNGLKVDSVSLDGRTARFQMKGIGASFEGTLSEDGKQLDGTFTQGGRPTPMTFIRATSADLPKPVHAPADLKGLWEGAIKLPGGIELRLVLRVEPAKEGEPRLVPYLDSPDQGANGIPITAIDLKGKAVHFEVKTLGVNFDGTLDQAEGTIQGTFMQSGLKLPLELKKTEKVSEVKRPQEPKAPLPYRAEDVTFDSVETPGVTLAGTLTLPQGDGPFPAAVLVSGSGPQNRDELLLGHKPFLVLADDLTRRGVAVLRFDDRGTARSTGDFSKATTQDFANDALGAVRFLKTRKEIAGDKIGVIGHSEGGLIAPIVATKAPDEVAFLVLMAGPGVPGAEILVRQQGLIAQASGMKPDQVEALQTLTAKVIQRLSEGGNDDELKKEFETIEKQTKALMSPEEIEALDSLEGGASTEAQLQQLRSPWFAYFLTYDPRPTLRQVKCPVLAVNGEKDLQVDPAQNLPEIEKALKEGGNARFKLVELPGLNHLFQPSKTGAPAEYGKIETTIDPTALEVIGTWVIEVTGNRN